MHIIISNSNQKPIYEQIIEQIKNAIISGILKEGEALPSMRLLAKELRISVITTKRAYEELEREGFITSMTGKGSFVAPTNNELLKEEQFRKIDQMLQTVVSMAQSCNISLNELSSLLAIVYKGD